MISIVQSAAGIIGPISANGASGSVSFPSPTTAGNTILAIVSELYPHRPSPLVATLISDDAGNGYSSAFQSGADTFASPGYPNKLTEINVFSPSAPGGTPSIPHSMQTFTITLDEDLISDPSFGSAVTFNVWLLEINGVLPAGYTAWSGEVIVQNNPFPHGAEPTPTTAITVPNTFSLTPPSGYECLTVATAIPVSGAGNITAVTPAWTLLPIQNGIGAAYRVSTTDTLVSPTFTVTSSLSYAAYQVLALGNAVPSLAVSPTSFSLTYDEWSRIFPVRHIVGAITITTADAWTITPDPLVPLFSTDISSGVGNATVTLIMERPSRPSKGIYVSNITVATATASVAVPVTLSINSVILPKRQSYGYILPLNY